MNTQLTTILRIILVSLMLNFGLTQTSLAAEHRLKFMAQKPIGGFTELAQLLNNSEIDLNSLSYLYNTHLIAEN